MPSVSLCVTFLIYVRLREGALEKAVRFVPLECVYDGLSEGDGGVAKL